MQLFKGMESTHCQAFGELRFRPTSASIELGGFCWKTFHWGDTRLSIEVILDNAFLTLNANYNHKKASWKGQYVGLLSSQLESELGALKGPGVDNLVVPRELSLKICTCLSFLLVMRATELPSLPGSSQVQAGQEDEKAWPMPGELLKEHDKLLISSTEGALANVGITTQFVAKRSLE